MKKLSFSGWFYLLSCIGLFFYSYTQVDLSLTLSRASLYQIVEKSFQYIGYFNRPLSTYLYIGLLVLLFGFYIRLLNLAAKEKIQRKTFWLLTILVTIVLTFSYNAFSYDIFNNIFDAIFYALGSAKLPIWSFLVSFFCSFIFYRSKYFSYYIFPF